MMTIKSKGEFQRVFREGARANRRTVRVCGVTCEGDGKVAFVAAKRLGTAVLRNRSKRVLREAMREVGVVDGCKVILFATRATAKAHPHDVACDLRQCLARLGFAQ